jgi:hypothetical protein
MGASSAFEARAEARFEHAGDQAADLSAAAVEGI